MDQVKIRVKPTTKGHEQIYADPKVRGFHDLLVKGGEFYAVYDPSTHLWSQKRETLSKLIDNDIQNFYDSYESKDGAVVAPMFMNDGSNGCWNRYLGFLRNLDNSPGTLNQKMIFSDQVPEREDYATLKLDYSIKPGECPCYEELMSTLYAPAERQKLEWGIGAMIDGHDIQKIQKMFVIYGDPGTGKSTILNIIEELFPGYIAYFSAEDLGKGYQFATAAFRNAPLVAIQHDGDLSRLWNNTILNQIVSHETIQVNEKGVKQYPIELRTMLFMATNHPVKVTDSKSGLIRRLIDIHPTGKKIKPDKYFKDLDGIKFELGAIADHCLKIYRNLGRSYYDGYVPTDMIARTNDVYNFIQDEFEIFDTDDPLSLAMLWRTYKAWADDFKVNVMLKRSDFMYELQTYFDTMERHGSNVTFQGFKYDKFTSKKTKTETPTSWIRLDTDISEFDKLAADYQAQYARNDESGAPKEAWDNVKTTLKDIDTKKLHWVRVPENHIVLDFDVRGDDGEKNLEANIKAASEFPPTYTEVSKSGNGLHLHYIYDGDVSRLKNLYSTHIEIKVYKGKSSLRRQLSRCNDLEVAHISSGLPLKGEKTLINQQEIQDERHLRNIIKNALLKKYQPGTKPSIDFIAKVLDEAYEQGLVYDVRDLQQKVMHFAMGSTHWADYCLTVVTNMKFQSEKMPEGLNPSNTDKIIFYDVEVFPNLFMICFMDSDSDIVRSWINPPRESVITLMEQNLVGFNNRKYDNHILYAWGFLNYSNSQLYDLSKRIVSGQKDALFSQAYNISYADIYDFSSKKQSLKKWEIELGIDHHELGMDWDSDIPKEQWPLVESYCKDDVRATKAVFNHLSGDFEARKILAQLSGLTVNDTNNTHTAKIIFGDERHPQSKFNYPDLAELFPGYTFDPYAPKDQKSKYMGEYPSEGGYVFVYGMDNGDLDQDYMNIKHPWEEQ